MKEFAFTQRQKKCISLGIVAVFLLFCGAVGWFVGRPMVRFAREPEQFRAWVAGFGIWGGLLYAGMTFLQVLVALIPGEPLEICGGYAFGAVPGTLLCLLGATAGSILVFWLVRRFGRAIVELFFSREKVQSLTFLHSSPRRDFLFWLIFMMPGTPKDLLCYFAGLTDLPWRKWLFICSVGRLPSIITSTIGGGALGTENYGGAVWVFAATAALSLLGVGIYRLVTVRNEKTHNT